MEAIGDAVCHVFRFVGFWVFENAVICGYEECDGSVEERVERSEETDCELAAQSEKLIERGSLLGGEAQDTGDDDRETDRPLPAFVQAQGS